MRSEKDKVEIRADSGGDKGGGTVTVGGVGVGNGEIIEEKEGVLETGNQPAIESEIENESEKQSSKQETEVED